MAVDVQSMPAEPRGVKRLRTSWSLSPRPNSNVLHKKMNKQQTSTSTSTSTTLPSYHEASPPVANDKPEEFTGAVKVSQKTPTQSDLDSVDSIPVYDAEGKARTFGSLHSGDAATTKVLVIFIRHFFCGLCQEYLRTLCSSVTPSSLPTTTSIVVIGHGSPDLISFYATATSCTFPIYAEPTKTLYAGLGMARTLNLGVATPDYIQKGFLHVSFASIVQSLAQGRKAFRGGDYWQVGGEFLFERKVAGRKHETEDAHRTKTGKMEVTWCHRMTTTRDHAEIPKLREVLGLDEAAVPQRKRWSLTGSGIVRTQSTRKSVTSNAGSGGKKGINGSDTSNDRRSRSSDRASQNGERRSLSSERRRGSSSDGSSFRRRVTEMEVVREVRSRDGEES